MRWGQGFCEIQRSFIGKETERIFPPKNWKDLSESFTFFSDLIFLFVCNDWKTNWRVHKISLMKIRVKFFLFLFTARFSSKAVDYWNERMNFGRLLLTILFIFICSVTMNCLWQSWKKYGKFSWYAWTACYSHIRWNL